MTIDKSLIEDTKRKFNMMGQTISENDQLLDQETFYPELKNEAKKRYDTPWLALSVVVTVLFFCLVFFYFPS